MHRITFVTIFAVIIAMLVGIWLMTRERWAVITAGPIVASPSNPRLVRGSFKITSPLLASLIHPRAIASHGTGGACLIADVTALNVPLPKTCTTTAYCTDNLPTELESAYCLSGKCWVKGASAQYCNKPPIVAGVPQPRPDGTYSILEATEVDLSDMYQVMRSLGARGNFSISWMVLACLNPADPTKPSKDKIVCNTVNPVANGAREDSGDILTVN